MKVFYKSKWSKSQGSDDVCMGLVVEGGEEEGRGVSH